MTVKIQGKEYMEVAERLSIFREKHPNGQIMTEIIESCGGEVVGFTSREDYNYEYSRAERGDQFCGLCIDQENQARKTQKRIDDWVKQLKKEFN